MTAVRTSADALLTCPTLRPNPWEWLEAVSQRSNLTSSNSWPDRHRRDQEVTRRNYFRRGFLFWLRPELDLLNRFAFAATRFRYRRTISSPEAPDIRLAVASRAASIFSRTISSASRRALLPPRISF